METVVNNPQDALRQKLYEAMFLIDSAQAGTERSRHRVTVENFQFLGRASEDTRESGNRDTKASEPERQSGDNLDAPQDDIPF